jgi:hypothetical protein
MSARFRSPAFLLVALALLLALRGLQPATQARAAHPAQPGDLLGQGPSVPETWTSIVISNEAPGYLVDHLIAMGHGGETLFQVLGYLKAQSGGVISDAFYDQVAGAVPGSEVFTATLNNYAGLDGGIEICADGTISIPSIEGSDYQGKTGYPSRRSLDNQFTYTYAQGEAYYIYTHTTEYGGGVTRDYYAFAIAWKHEAVTTFIISNEGPGYLVDHLIAQGHGGETLFQVLGYLKGQSGGVISDEFYNKVASAGPGSSVFTDTLGNYAGVNGGIEICADGTMSIPSVMAASYQSAPGYATTPSQDGAFRFTTAQDLGHYIYTHAKNYEAGISKDYYAFAIAWSDGAAKVFMPLVRK